LRMEPSWTEPPPLAWVLIGGGERPVRRRQSGAAALSEPKRCGSIVHGRKEEHAAQGRAMVRSGKGRSWTGEDHSKSSLDGGGRSAGTVPTRRNVPTPH
jgi:hypothetical protein